MHATLTPAIVPSVNSVAASISTASAEEAKSAVRGSAPRGRLAAAGS